ncbi:hypothetical protein SAMN04490248_11393 [Salinihabitans flavidus]|uniref:Phage regulatory protein CII (CP76) n=1 Tax=Salinihabitans flavidus TaxID=569882 RepID=A0A1H8SYX1_9RHOB|nr:hypothetical protein [Salinihabitans flavidus]SEO83403.1 hypothetical protein SAMN04490248_11393 [Salinihabitans flavidus]
MDSIGSYLKKHTEALVKDIGIETACAITGKSKATLGRYYSTMPDHSERFIPVDTVATLEKQAKYPHVTAALAELNAITLSYDKLNHNVAPGRLNADVIKLAQRFAILMAEYNQATENGIITNNESKRLLQEAVALQQVLLDMKAHLQDETG